MKQYKITVNNKAYDVIVEEVGGINAPVLTQVPACSVPLSASAPAPVVVQVPKATLVASGGELVSAPMPGTIFDIKVTQGQTVKAGDVLLILEAMKMENEIVSPIEGTITSIHTAKGTSVNSGDALITIG